MTQLMNKSIAELHDLLVKKKVTAKDLVLACIEECKKDTCNSFEATAFEEAIKASEKIKEVKDEEYLKGIPFLAKDNYSTKGIETTASSNILNGYIPLFDATVIEKLKRAGMILVGKTTMDELAMGGTGISGHKGVTTNPYDHTRIVGGSSCGSASSVASGIVPFSLGSDTGDSVRKPASYAGIVGFKPTWGRISRFGLFPFAPSLDTVAYFTRNVKDASYILTCLAGKDKKDMSSSSRKKEKYQNYVLSHKTLKRIGCFKSVLDSIEEKAIKDAYLNVLNGLANKGYEIIYYDFPQYLLDSLYPTYMIISCAEATSNNANLDGIRFGPKADNDPQTYIEYMKQCRTKGFSSIIKRRFVIGSFSLLSANQDEMFTRAQKARRMIVEEMERFFDNIDYLLVPASYSKPKKVEDINYSWSKKTDFLENIMTIGNFGGYPSLTVPLTFIDGLPCGVNITGRTFEDGYVLSLGQEIEGITGLKNLVANKGE